MLPSRSGLLVLSGAVAAITIAASQIAVAQQKSKDVIGELASNEGIFVDAKTFKIAKGKAKGDPSAQIAKLGAKEVGPGAIIFRSGNKLYIAEGAPAPQAMKSFQDNWNVSYINAMKNFQDNWNVSFMKYPEAGIDPAYMTGLKNFQDNWNASYMNAMKDFQDKWNVSYAKDFQDNWNISYMKALKDFQDNWSTSYMK